MQQAVLVWSGESERLQADTPSGARATSILARRPKAVMCAMCDSYPEGVINELTAIKNYSLMD